MNTGKVAEMFMITSIKFMILFSSLRKGSRDLKKFGMKKWNIDSEVLLLLSFLLLFKSCV